MPLPRENKIYTYKDYLSWPDNERWEIIDGNVYLMAPLLRIHQKVLGAIFYQLFNYLQGKSCEVYTAPFGVRLPSGEEKTDRDIKTVVEPDIVVKFNLYEEFGVREYWIVEPESKIVSVFTLQDNKRYGRPEIYTDEDKIKAFIFDDLVIDLKSVFAY